MTPPTSQALPHGSGAARVARWPAGGTTPAPPPPSGRSGRSAAALSTLAPALPHPPGTVRHVPDLVGAVLSASAVAAGVLAVSWGGAWGRLSPRSPTAPPARPVAAARRLGNRVGFGAAGTEVVPGGAIGVTGATVPIDRPSSRRPAPGHASVPVAVPMAAVLLAAAALVRVAGATGHETVRRSQDAAEEGPAASRRPLAAPPGRHSRAQPSRVQPSRVRDAARTRFTPSDSRVVNPR
ncbi:MAG TPA: hypothetical protein VFV66_00275 [Nonomuraea sp.]|nr:hypothetical protein [Nonomuraea sp.]